VRSGDESIELTDRDERPELTAAGAERLLAGAALISAMEGPIPQMKSLRDRCLAAGIPALVGRPPGACKG